MAHFLSAPCHKNKCIMYLKVKTEAGSCWDTKDIIARSVGLTLGIVCGYQTKDLQTKI